MPRNPFKTGMHLNAHRLLRRAKKMRKAPTPAERALWEIFRDRKVYGMKFRRQHPILYYIADFYCHELRLVVEVDGGIHRTAAQREHDKKRTENLEANGIRVVRFTNQQVFERPGEIIKVLQRLKEKSPQV